MSTIIQFNAENVKRLRVVEIKPSPTGAVIIGGENEQGKSSVLDAIEMGLLGGRSIPEKPIHDGEKRAVIKLDLGDFVVTRTITPSGARLEVKNADGTIVASPQALLDSITGSLTFDPLAFARYGALEQVDALKRVLGLDFSKVDEERAELYEERTGFNRELKAATEMLKKFPDPAANPDAYAAEAVDVAELNAELERANESNLKAGAIGNRVAAARDEVRRVQEIIDGLKIKLLEAEEEHKAAEADMTALQKEMDAVQTVPTTPILDKIRNAESINARFRLFENRKATMALVASKGKEAGECTALIEDIDREKAETIAKAAERLPVPKMGLTDSGVTVAGIPFAQASSAQKLKVSMAVGLAMNPGIKVVLIRDGSLLDDSNLKLVADMAEQAGAQVWVERVGDGKEVSVIMEDGAVKG